MAGRDKNIKRPEPRSVDAFGKRIADNTRSVLDFPSHFQYSPERLRLFKGGSRQFVQYGSVTGFTDAADTYQIAPSSGETWHIEGAESTSYTVGYITDYSFAFELNQSLQSGDKIKIGAYNGNDGWYMEQRGSDHDDTTVDIIEECGGSTTTLLSDAKLSKPTTEWNRYEVRYNWYNVGNQVWVQTYTDDGVQHNDEFAQTSNDGSRGPQTGNLNAWQEVTAGSSTSNLQLNVGSMGAITLGNATKLTRSKPQLVTVDLPATNDTWLPVYAIRLNPDVANVNARLRSLDILNYGNNTTVEVVAASMSPDKTSITSSDWELPDYHHSQNSAIQEASAGTDSTFDVPDDSGTKKTLGSSDKYGGFTLLSAAIESGGGTVSDSSAVSAVSETKKAILRSDQVVFLVRTPNAGATLRFIWAADQDW